MCHKPPFPGVLRRGAARRGRFGGKFTLSGDGLCVGYDSGDAVSAQYSSPARFKGGKIFGVGVTVEQAQYEDLNREAQRMLMKE